MENELQQLTAQRQIQVVLVVLNNFMNDSRVLKEALSLRDVGMSVSVCAMHDEGLPQQEMQQGIDVCRVRLKSRGWTKMRLVQILKYLEFIARSVSRFRKFDIIHCNDLNALPVGVVIKLLNRKAKLLYDAHEYEIHRSASQGPLSIKANYYLERFLIRFADGVTMTSQADADEYAKMYGIPVPYVVMNCPPLTPRVQKQDIFRERFAIPAGRIIYLYQGALHQARGIQAMLDAFAKVGDGSACIVFMGYGTMEADIRCHAEQYPSIHFHEAVPPEELYRYTASADCGIIYMGNTCANHNYALPNKLFEYVMAQIPTVTTPLQEIKRVVDAHGLGFISAGEDAASLYQLIQSIDELDLQSLEPNLLKAREIFTWENQERIFLRAYYRMLM